MSIQLQHISKCYGTQWALNQIELEIERGKITALLGPNGAGKSTMLKIISGYIPPTHGKAIIHGIDVMQYPIEVKKLIGYLPEHNPLYLDMYVREYLHYIAGVYGIKKQLKNKINRLIERTGLQAEQNKQLSALSKGYRQRVGLAQALLHDPEVLILDEPTTGLDPNQIIEIRALIKEISKDKTVLLSTHIMQEVEAICNQVIILNKGEIAAQGSPNDIKKHIQHHSTIITVEFNKPINTSDLRSIADITAVKADKGNIYIIESKADKDIRQALFNWAVEHQLSILSLTQTEDSMENVFRELTQAKA